MSKSEARRRLGSAALLISRARTSALIAASVVAIAGTVHAQDAGPPSVALWFWRESLRSAGEDRHVVQLFQSPDTSDLERLPDHALLVLRSILQADWASFDDVTCSTTLPADRVREALRYSRLRGYVDQRDDRYWVNWTWFRAVTRVLHRRHLLAGGLG